jgi:hypothetical protein
VFLMCFGINTNYLKKCINQLVAFLLCEVESDSKLLSGFPYSITENLDNNLNSPCTFLNMILFRRVSFLK